MCTWTASAQSSKAVPAEEGAGWNSGEYALLIFEFPSCDSRHAFARKLKLVLWRKASTANPREVCGLNRFDEAVAGALKGKLRPHKSAIVPIGELPNAIRENWRSRERRCKNPRERLTWRAQGERLALRFARQLSKPVPLVRSVGLGLLFQRARKRTPLSIRRSVKCREEP